MKRLASNSRAGGSTSTASTSTAARRCRTPRVSRPRSAPPEAKPTGSLTLEPTYVAYLDDQVAFFYDTLPKGTFDFYFRTRAQIPGTFVQPPAKAEMMYDRSVVGAGAGASVSITPPLVSE